ncbi:unnamed protein product [marine sediment metagenome]|uniref:Uncharacterized protein n=1 Tax=marine sediment metagenome TaxID=412755 RepID=X1NPA2_9ZZZZ
MGDIVLVEGSNELNVQMPPIVAAVSITSASWEFIDYPGRHRVDYILGWNFLRWGGWSCLSQEIKTQ